MLPFQVDWAEKEGFKVVYWTHDINNRALNSLYQGKRVMPGKKSFFENPSFKKFELDRRYLFKVSRKSDFLQYVYAAILQPDFIWKPKTNMVPYEHDGSDINVQEVLKRSENIAFS